MVKLKIPCLFIIVLIIGVISCRSSENTQPHSMNSLWPEIEPFRTGSLQVSDLHKIYYELSGRKEGVPVMVVHGGPGGYSPPSYRRYFNPSHYLIILFDQRGCGRSTPYAELKQNTTGELTEDMEKLRRHLGIGKVILFGGSWGSTLSLAYAEEYPENVGAMVLSGIFTATREEIYHFYNTSRSFFPEAYDRFAEILEGPVRPDWILHKIQSESEDDRMRFSRAWSAFEFKLAQLSFSDYEVARIVQHPDLAGMVYTLALIENHYMTNGCFLKEGELLENTERIRDIPTVLVNGRYDMICPPVNAYRLHKRLANSRLKIIEEAGHSAGEPGILNALLEVMREYERTLELND